MVPIEARAMREFLVKSWMTHDGMWFRHSLEVCGIEKTNQINRAAIYAAAKIEAQRLAKLLEVERIDSFAELVAFIQNATEIIRGDFMHFACHAPEHNVLRWEMPQCFAYDGISRLGVIEQYQCGIFERVKGWLDSLGVAYTISPEVSGCMMVSEGHCFREFRFSF